MAKNETAIVERAASSIQTYNGANPIGSMLNAVVEKGISAENVAAMKDLVALYERVEDRNAAKQFAEAKAALQAELPKVAATGVIPNNDGTVRSRFASFEDIMDAVAPYLNKHGFSVSFDVNVIDDGKRLEAVCKLMHIGGHREENKFAVRVGSGPPKASEAQADGAARSYARRGALCDALNIVVDRDTDARSEGGFITEDQADDLKRRLKSVGGDVDGFLKFAGAKSFEDIRTGKYGALDSAIAAKERKAASATPQRTTTPAEDAEFANDLLGEPTTPKPKHRV